jgi:hypothetical protein
VGWGELCPHVVVFPHVLAAAASGPASEAGAGPRCSINNAATQRHLQELHGPRRLLFVKLHTHHDDVGAAAHLETACTRRRVAEPCGNRRSSAHMAAARTCARMCVRMRVPACAMRVTRVCRPHVCVRALVVTIRSSAHMAATRTCARMRVRACACVPASEQDIDHSLCTRPTCLRRVVLRPARRRPCVQRALRAKGRVGWVLVGGAWGCRKTQSGGVVLGCRNTYKTCPHQSTPPHTCTPVTPPLPHPLHQLHTCSHTPTPAAAAW